MSSLASVSIKPHIVLDIDGVLAQNRTHNLQETYFFHTHGTILTAIRTHYLFPGVIEFIKFLFSLDVRLSFFSSGHNERNGQFVSELLNRVCQDAYKDRKEEVGVYSREHRSESTFEARSQSNRIFGVFSDAINKNLTKCITSIEELAHTILIDDAERVVAPGQEKNILLVPTTDAEVYSKCESRVKKYQQDGYKFLECQIINDKCKQSLEPFERKVQRGKAIILIKQSDRFEARFIDKHTLAPKIAIVSSGAHHPELTEKLTRFYANKEKGDWDFDDIPITAESYVIDQEEIARDVREFVSAQGGVDRKICRGINRIYYIAGLLFKVFNEAKEKQIPITEVLFSMQFTADKTQTTYQSNFGTLARRDEFYELGLQQLQRFNRELMLISPPAYYTLLQRTIPQDMENLITKARENQEVASDCCLM